MFISIVLSFYSEEKVIPELIRRLRAVLNKDFRGNYELIFVNDASADRSLELLLEASKNHNDVKVINMSRRFGVSACVVAGMKYAKGDVVIYMDADLQDPPEVIPKLIDKWLEGNDVVHTTRTAREDDSFIKIWVTKWAYRILNFTSDIDLPLDSGDFKLLSRRVVDELLKLNEKDPFLRGLIPWIGFKQSRVFYRREKRFAGKSHFPLYSSGPRNTFLSGLTSFSLLPLNISLFMSFIVFFVGIVHLIAIIIMRYLGMNIPGWSMVMAAVLFLGGIQLFVIGALGLYLGKVYNEVKNRPNYIIDSMYGFEEKRTPEDLCS